MKTPNTLVDLLTMRYTSSVHGITHIYGDQNEFYVSYPNLYLKALQILHHLQSQGIQPGDEIILQVEDNIMFLYTFWACLLGGIIPVPVTVGNNEDHRLKFFKIWDVLHRPHLIAEEKTFLHLEKYAACHDQLSVLRKIKQNTIFMEQADQEELQGLIYKPQSNDIAYIQFSSGTTGDSKGVILTHRNLLANLNGAIFSAAMNSQDAFFSWMPLTHDMGMIGYHLLPILLDVNQYIMPTSLFIRRPVLWLKKAQEYRATILSSPNFGYDYFLNYFTPESSQQWDLSHIRLIFNGAEPIAVDLCERFLERMNQFQLKKETMYTIYGLAEASLAVAFPRPGEEFSKIMVNRSSLGIGQTVIEVDKSNSTEALTLAVEGYPVKDCYIRICDEKNTLLDELTVGFVHISGENVTVSYYNNQDATSAFISDDGWINTGDLGFFKDRKLVITGRANDLISIEGRNYYPHDIEKLAQEIDGVELGKVTVCGVSNPGENHAEVVVFILFKKKIEEFIPMVVAIRNHLHRRIGLFIKNVIPIKDTPKTTSGKVQRYKLVEMYRNGEYDAVLDTINSLLTEPERILELA